MPIKTSWAAQSDYFTTAPLEELTAAAARLGTKGHGIFSPIRRRFSCRSRVCAAIFAIIALLRIRPSVVNAST